VSATSPPTPAQPAVADRFARLIEGLCRAIAARSALSRLAAPLLILVWRRLRRTAARFAALTARIRAGRLPRPTAGRRRPAGRPPDAARPPRPPPQRLPARSAWLIRLVPEAACSASQLRHLLDDPEMAALIAATPQMGRLLRPLCRMLGVDPPPGLRPPGRRAPPAAAPAAPSRPAAPKPAPPARSPPTRSRRPRRYAPGLGAFYAPGVPIPR